MTVSTTIIKNSHNGNGSTTTFAYQFKILQDSDLQVIIRSSNGTETTKSLSTHYTVTGAGGNSGTVVFTSGNIPVNGETVVIRRNVPQTQVIDYIANDPFPAETHEEGLDRGTLVAQQISEEADRSIKLSRTNTMASTEFTVGATDRANKILSFDSAGELAVASELGSFKGNWSASTSYAVRDMVKDTSTNNIFMANTAHTSSGSQPLTSNTDAAKWDLIVDAATATSAASTATTQAGIATTKAGEASTSAATATTQANTATTQAGIATTKAGEAATSATGAENAKNAAEAALDTFDDKFLGSKSSDPTVDNDGNALTDGALYFNTTLNVMKVYDLGNTQWKQLVPTTSQQANIDTVAAANSNITAVAGQISPTNNISTVATNTTAIGQVGGAIANVNLVGGSIGNVNEVGNNMGTVNEFGERYRVASSAPSTSLNEGDLYFDTTADELKVYKSSGWSAAGSTINGTSARFNYVATSNQTTFTGADTAGNTLAYDAGFVDVYLNGSKLLNGTDVTVTSGSSVVLAVGATTGDIIDIVGFGTFNVAAINAANINSGTLAVARGGTGISSLSGNAGKALLVNANANGYTLANASSAEVYGFSKNNNGQLIVTTTNQGADNISSSTFATFDDVLFSASGFTFSISNGELIATI
jgi:hypothetical protein